MVPAPAKPSITSFITVAVAATSLSWKSAAVKIGVAPPVMAVSLVGSSAEGSPNRLAVLADFTYAQRAGKRALIAAARRWRGAGADAGLRLEHRDRQRIERAAGRDGHQRGRIRGLADGGRLQRRVDHRHGRRRIAARDARFRPDQRQQLAVGARLG